MNNPQNKEHIKRAKKQAQEQAKNFINIEAIFSGIFAVVGSVFAAIILSGTGFSFDTFTNPKFYISTAISFGIMMYAYNFAKTIFVRQLKRSEKGKYFKAETQEGRIQKYIHDWHHQGLIEEAAKNEDELRRKSEAQYLLNKRTYGLDIEVVEDIDNPGNIATNDFAFEKFVKSRSLRKREIRRLRKTLRKVLNGKYQYEAVDKRDLLSDMSASPHLSKKFKLNENVANLKENRKKAITFLVSTAVTNALIWQGLDPSFWSALLAQFMLIMSSIGGAYTVALSRVNDLTTVMENRNEFNYNALQNELKKIPLGVSPTIEQLKPLLETPKPTITQSDDDEEAPLEHIERMLQLNDKINASS